LLLVVVAWFFTSLGNELKNLDIMIECDWIDHDCLGKRQEGCQNDVP
jgi:hypothetical protein